MKNGFYLIIIIWITAGCSYKTLKTPTEKDNLSNKGVVIINFEQLSTKVGLATMTRFYNIKVIALCNAETKKCYNYNINEKYLIIPLQEQGNYYVQYIDTNGLATFDTGTFDKKANKGTIASFEIKKGEIVYLGDVSILVTQGFYQKQKFHICVKDKLKEMESYIKLNYPFLNSKNIQYKPLELGTQSEYKCD
jgi:hypothetical protein